MDYAELFRLINQTILDAGFDPLIIYMSFFVFHLFIYASMIIGHLSFLLIYRFIKDRKEKLNNYEYY